MSGLLFGVVVLVGGFLAARHIRRLADTPDIHDVFADEAEHLAQEGDA
ncbi:hypothetical protein [Streptosporangium sp. NPDC004631]